MKTFKRLLALCLCGTMLLSLCACRYSSVLEQIIYDMLRSQEIDQDADFHPEENDPENQDTSDDLKDLVTDDTADRATEETPELSQTVSDQPGEVVETELTADGDSGLSAAQGTESVTGTDETGSADQTDTGLTETDDYEGNSAAQTWKQVVDAYGNAVNIPENVDQVAAAGELAVMVLMLGGADRLAATSSSLTGGGLAQTIFSGLSDTASLWSGDGQVSMSADSFQTLLELAPDVVLETSGSSTLTDSQVQQLEEQGTAYLVLPQPTSPENIATIMTTLGTVLGDRSGQGGTNAPQRAQEYIAWVSQVSTTVSQATASYAGYTDDDTGESVSGTYTLYVDGWDDGAYYRLYNEQYVTLSGYGCAVVNSGATVSCKTLSSYLGLAHVVNTAAQYGISPKSLYFTPLVSAYRTMEVTGSQASGMVSAGQKLLEQSDGSLGTSNFSILLAADRHTAQAIAQSELWQVYPHINSGDGSFNSDGFLDEEGNLVRTQISGAYEIVVNPRGLSSWTSGSAESILESVWAAWRFFGAISETDMRGYISDFYAQFYGYSLSGAELDQILEGT
jgi:ABC-type Fe3+-hydroxamate transport system substrate-binding protein